jgi:hypothetical protein
MSDNIIECKLKDSIKFLYNQSVEEPINLDGKTNEELLDILIEIGGAMQQVINDSELTYIDKVKVKTKKTKSEIHNIIENYVGYRFQSLETASIRLSKDFGYDLKVIETNVDKEEQLDFDFQLGCAIEEEEVDITLFYLKDNGDRYLITEVSFNGF